MDCPTLVGIHSEHRSTRYAARPRPTTGRPWQPEALRPVRRSRPHRRRRVLRLTRVSARASPWRSSPAPPRLEPAYCWRSACSPLWRRPPSSFLSWWPGPSTSAQGCGPRTAAAELPLLYVTAAAHSLHRARCLLAGQRASALDGLAGNGWGVAAVVAGALSGLAVVARWSAGTGGRRRRPGRGREGASRSDPRSPRKRSPFRWNGLRFGVPE